MSPGDDSFMFGLLRLLSGNAFAFWCLSPHGAMTLLLSLLGVVSALDEELA
jgi:hypothetical protein